MATTPNPPINVPPINPTTGTFVNQWVQWFNLMYKNIGGTQEGDFVTGGSFDENGYMIRTGLNEYTSRSITGKRDEIIITNGNGEQGPTVISIDPVLKQSLGLIINNLIDIEDQLDYDNDYGIVYDDSTATNKKVLASYLTRQVKNYLPHGDLTLNSNDPGNIGVLTGHNTGWIANGISIMQSSAGRYSITKSSTVPTTAQAGKTISFSLRVDVSTADASIASADYSGIRIGAGVEALYDLAKNGNMMITFWIRSTITGTYCLNMRLLNGLTGAGERVESYIVEYTVDAANTWEYKTITIPSNPDFFDGGTVQPIAYDNSSSSAGIVLNFALCGGVNVQALADEWLTTAGSTGGLKSCTSNQVNAISSTANDIYLADVRLFAGNVDRQTNLCTPQEAVDLTSRWTMAGSVNNVATQIDTTTVKSSEIVFPTYQSFVISSGNIFLYTTGGTVGSLSWTDQAATTTSRVSTIPTVTRRGFAVQQTVALEYQVQGFWYYNVTSCDGLLA